MDNLVIDPITKEYLRYKNNENLELKIGLLYNQENVILTNSGLHSNYIVINTIINNNDNINLIYSDELYHETIEVIKYYKNINSYKINNYLIDKIFNQNNILFIESCSNPNGYIFDFSLIQKLRQISKKLYVICDNTWLSSCIFNPFIHDVDIVTASLSKFYSGGCAIGGVCLFKNNDDYIITNNYIKITGIHNSSLQFDIIDQKINNLEERINNSSKLTRQILEYLSQYSEILINHPLIETHSSFHLMKKYFKNDLIPSTFTIGFKICDIKLFEILNKLTILNIETSFGSILSKIDNYVTKINDNSFIRISIGYNDNFERIKLGLEELLKQLCFIYE